MINIENAYLHMKTQSIYRTIKEIEKPLPRHSSRDKLESSNATTIMSLIESILREREREISDTNAYTHSHKRKKSC